METLYFTNDPGLEQAAGFLTDELENRLIESVSYISILPKHILSVGAGAAENGHNLRAAFPAADIQNAGLVDSLPVENESVDLLFAGHSLLFAKNLGLVFREWQRVLKPESPIFFSSLGPATLQELRQSFAVVDTDPHVAAFMDLHDLGDLLLKSGFADPVMHSELVTLEYSGFETFFAELKAVGANRWVRPTQKGLMGKHKWQRMLDAYASAFKTAEQKIPATVEMLFGHAWKKKNESAKLSSQEILIPVGNIGKVPKRKRGQPEM